VGRYVQQDLGIEFGLICTDNVGGFASNTRFGHFTLDGLKNYLAAGGTADHYILMSWYPYPDQSVPDLRPEQPTQTSIFLKMVQELTS
jgi:hypothetical protein